MRRIGAFDKIRYSHRILRGYNFQIVAGRDEVRQKIANESMRSSAITKIHEHLLGFCPRAG